MSQLQKAITRAGRREGTGIGFGQASREQPRAMLAGMCVNDAAGAHAAMGSGADFVVAASADAAGAAAVIAAVKDAKVPVGAIVEALDESGAEALRRAGCDFAISPLAETSAAAMDTEKMGQVLVATADLSDTTLRSLGPLGLDALYVDQHSGPMTLAGQLELVRLGSFASCPLMAAVKATAGTGELRVLRDSGVSAVITPAGTTKAQFEGLIVNLKAVPTSRKSRQGAEIALVPTMRSRAAEEDEEDDDDDDE